MSRKRSNIVKLMIISLIMGLFPQELMGTPRPFHQQYKAIHAMARDTKNPMKRANAVTELIAMVMNEATNVNLRQFAAAKLGEFGVIEAEDTLKAVAENLEWADSTRYLKRAATLAYWKIKVVKEPNKEAQENLLIKLLWGKNHPPPHSSVVPSWAADELANRGVNKALPEIIKSIRYRNPTERGEEHIRLCTTKIELLSSSESRQEALTRALAMEDFTNDQLLKRWAIEELAKLNTRDSRYILIGFALELQSRYYDENGRFIMQKNDRLGVYAGLFYNNIIKTLKDSLFTDSEIKETGLQPDRFFIMSP